MKSSRILVVIGSFLFGVSLSTTITRAEDNTTNFIFTDGAVHGFAGDLTVGVSGTNNYAEVSNGSVVTNSGNAQISLNYGTARDNLALISGPGSAWNPQYYMIVGFFGTGARLVITNGGTVTSPFGGIIGYYYPEVTNNTVEVTGTGSRWTMNGALWVGGNGADNHLLISDGATVTNTTSTSVGLGGFSSNNLLRVTGPGSVFYNGGDLGIGGGGGNTIWVANGGSLISPNIRGFAGINNQANQIVVTNGGYIRTSGISFGESPTTGGNLIKVSGAGSVWTNLDATLIGISSSNNTLRVENGGKMYNLNNTFIGGYFGSFGAYNSVQVTGVGSLLDMNVSGGSSATYLGYAGDGNTLDITSGGQVNASTLYNNTRSNRLTVSGTGSTLNASTYLGFNFGGNDNTFVVTNGGKVVALATTLGYYGNNGLIEVTGAGSVYSNTTTFNLSVASGGTNTLAVRNGGSLYVGDSLNVGNGTGQADRLLTTGGGQVKILTNLIIGNSPGNSVLVSDGGSSLNVGLALYVGNLYANNSLVISNGAAVTSSQALIGNYGNLYGYTVTNNSVLVTGTGSVWSNTTYGLYVGNIGDHNSLRIEDGGKVVNTGGAVLMGNASSGSNNLIAIRGAGSLLASPGQDITIGSAGSGNSIVVADGGRMDAGVTLNVGVLSSGNSLVVTNGGKVFSAQGVIGYYGAPYYSAYNNVTVSDSGSVWSNSTYPIYVGLNGSSNKVTIAKGGKVYSPTVYVSYGIGSEHNTIEVTGDGSMLRSDGVTYVGNLTGPTSDTDAHVDVTDGGTLETADMRTGISNSGTISNRSGIYQFATASPTIIPNTANSITLSNGTIAYRDVASANIFNAQVANIAFSGNNAFRLNNSSNTAVSAYTFNTGLGATNYYRLELVNGGSRWQGTTLNIGSGGSLLVSNSANASIAANVSIDGLAEVVNSKATFGGTVNVSGRFVSDPSTNTYLGDVTVAQSGSMAGGNGDLFNFKKSLYIHSTNQIGFNLAQSAVEFSGGGMHTNAITGKDLGGKVTAFDIAFTYQTNFAYGELHIESAADQVCFECGNIPVAPSNALYVGWLDLLTNTTLVANLHTPSSINIYYSGLDTRNAYLGNQTFQLTACDGVTLGGFLMPVIPEPSTLILLLSGLGALAAGNHRRKIHNRTRRTNMKQMHKTLIAGVVGICLLTGLRSEAQLSAVHRYDFEGDGGTNLFGGGITEPGWQKITAASNTTAGVPGWIAGDTHNTYGTAIYRGPSTQTPDLVVRELMIGSGQGTPIIGVSEPTMAFRDIIPTNAFDVSYTIWRSDPGDSFFASFLSTISINGGPEVLIDSGDNVPGFYHPPIKGFLSLLPTNVVTTLDFRFYDNFAPYAGSQVRLNGILDVFSVPEPTTSALLLMAGAAGLIARRKRETNRTTQFKALPTIMGAGLIAGTLFCATNAHAYLTVTNQYDFEASSGSITEPGWTHIDTSIAATPTSGGFILAQSTFFGGFNRYPSTQSPTNVTGDEIIGYGQGSTTTPTIVFRDIVPNSATNVSFTIWRSDPLDVFPAGFITKVSYDGGPQVLVNSGDPSFLFYHAPITFSMPLNAVATNTTLDFYFYDPLSGSSQTRIDGIQTVFAVPEPSVSLLLGGGLFAAWGMRRRIRRQS